MKNFIYILALLLFVENLYSYDDVNLANANMSYKVKVYQPNNLIDRSPVLLIFGSNDNFKDLKFLDFEKLANIEAFLICYLPEEFNNEELILDQLLVEIQNEFNIDSRRVYAIGAYGGQKRIQKLMISGYHKFAAISYLGQPSNSIKVASSWDPTSILVLDEEFSSSFVDTWIQNNSCNNIPVDLYRSDIDDENEYEHQFYNNGEKNTSVELLNLNPYEFIGNEWLTLEIWGFLSNFQKDGIMVPNEVEFYDDQVNIYPNPTNSAININFRERTSRKIRFISPGGEILLNENNSVYHYKIDIDKYPNGVYFLEIDNNVYKVVKSD